MVTMKKIRRFFLADGLVRGNWVGAGMFRLRHQGREMAGGHRLYFAPPEKPPEKVSLRKRCQEPFLDRKGRFG
jgi:hypothetical protein